MYLDKLHQSGTRQKNFQAREILRTDNSISLSITGPSASAVSVLNCFHIGQEPVELQSLQGYRKYQIYNLMLFIQFS